MSWRAPAVGDLQAAMTGTEIVELEDLALADGQTGLVAAVLTATVALVRGYLRGYAPTSMGAAGTLPPELIGPAMDIAVMKLYRRADKEPSDVRKAAAEAAMKLLTEALPKGEFRVEAPAETDGTTTAGATPSVSTTTRDDYVETYDGL